MSHALSEWGLLAVAEDIEQGDLVVVESDDGEDTEHMMFVKETGKTVLLKNKFNEIIKFSINTLEEVEGNRYVTGKAPD